MLKIKFEMLNSNHLGQLIKEKTLFQECLKRDIPKNEWAEFIKNEIKNPSNYIKSTTSKEM